MVLTVTYRKIISFDTISTQIYVFSVKEPSQSNSLSC